MKVINDNLILGDFYEGKMHGKGILILTNGE